MRIISIACTVVLVGGLFMGCDSGNSHEKDVCLDTVDELTSAFVGCGYDYAPTRAEFLQQLNGCDGVLGIRNESDLYDDCFPTLDTWPCADLEAGVMPASCQGQIMF